MTDIATLLIADTGQPARSVQLVDSGGFEAWLKGQSERTRAAVFAQKFAGNASEYAILPGDKPDEWSIAAGVADTARLSTWCLAKLAEALPGGTYRIEQRDAGPAMLGWLTAQYRFDRYLTTRDKTAEPRILVTKGVKQAETIARLAAATHFVRDLVNTPTSDMGPADLEKAAEAIARDHEAEVTITRGDALEHGYPMIHAVGRAAARSHAPRLIELNWGDLNHPRVTIIGKGVCFDSGGLDIKPSSAMRLMKKDMGGAAHALALAQLVMKSRLPIRLHLLIPAVENAIAGNAFRPGDVLKTRNGLTVEIGNTDAEGRLVLGDALARAGESEPELVLDFATLTGAARVALGPDIPALFANDDTLAAQLIDAGGETDDPLWRLPLWEPYEDMLKSDIADIANAGDSGFAGAITAALFLRKFVPAGAKWAHLDVFAWRQNARPGRPEGGDALGLRAAYALLEARYRKS